MWRVLIPLAILLCCAGSTLPARAAGDEVLVIAHIPGSADAHAGRAVLEEAYKRLGIAVEFRGFSAAAALEASNSGEADAELQRIDGISRTFKNLVQIPIPVNYIQGLAFSQQYNFPVKGWYSLKPHRIGIVKGILFAERGTEGMDVAVAATYAELIGWIEKGRVDVGVMPRIGGLLAIKRSGAKRCREMAGILETFLVYHYVHRSHADLVGRLGPILKEMLLDGTTREIREAAYKKLLEDG